MSIGDQWLYQRDKKKYGSKGALARYAGTQVGGLASGLAASAFLIRNPSAASKLGTFGMLGVTAGSAIAGGLAGRALAGFSSGRSSSKKNGSGRQRSAAPRKPLLSRAERNRRISEGLKRSSKVRGRKRR